MSNMPIHRYVPSFFLFLLLMAGNRLGAQMTVDSRLLRDDYLLKGSVKSVTEAHWDADGNFIGRQNNLFSRTGKVLEEIVFFGEGEQDIESMKVYDYNADGTVAAFYHYARGGENYAVMERFVHWIAFYDKQNRLLRKTTFDFQPKADKYGTTIWTRSREELFVPRDGKNDTIYTFDKKTGRTVTMRYDIKDQDAPTEGHATYTYTAKGDTASIVYDDPTGSKPMRRDYDYKYVSTKQKAAGVQEGGGQGRAISPVLQKRQQEAEKKAKKEGKTADTLRLEQKTVTTRYKEDNRVVVRTERYDDSSKLVNLNITETSDGGKKQVVEYRYNAKYQLFELETTRYVGTEMVYQMKDRFTYDRNGNPASRNRSGMSLTRPATWKFYYRDFDKQKNWTSRTYEGPAMETVSTSVSPQGNTIEKITYEGSAKETDTRVIKYY